MVDATGLKPAGAVVICAAGALLYRGGKRPLHVPGYKVQVAETTGCGDSFMAAVLAQLAGHSIDELGVMSTAELEPAEFGVRSYRARRVTVREGRTSKLV